MLRRAEQQMSYDIIEALFNMLGGLVTDPRILYIPPKSLVQEGLRALIHSVTAPFGT